MAEYLISSGLEPFPDPAGSGRYPLMPCALSGPMRVLAHLGSSSSTPPQVPGPFWLILGLLLYRPSGRLHVFVRLGASPCVPPQDPAFVPLRLQYLCALRAASGENPAPLFSKAAFGDHHRKDPRLQTSPTPTKIAAWQCGKTPILQLQCGTL